MLPLSTQGPGGYFATSDSSLCSGNLLLRFPGRKHDCAATGETDWPDAFYLSERITKLLRSHTCGELRLDQVGQEVTLCGWVDRNRDLGGVQFIDLRDRYGKTQVVFGPEAGADLCTRAAALRGEYVIQVTGKVAARPAATANPKLTTGEIELRATALTLLNASLTPPVSPSMQDIPGEDLRLKYRYLDLRREEMQKTILLRDRIIKIMRDYAADQKFVDVETPVLGRSTPEGARDYLVPSRVQNGKFYALP